FGTGLYAAPEVLQHIFTPMADVYSLGLSLAEVSVPFNDRFTTKEWNEMKEEQQLPTRANNVIISDLTSTILSMINRGYLSRPSVDSLLSTIEVSQKKV
ncbi:hypothetical protein PFISCL1PPCAC_2744, partial [Pristionchus fissidentatus]